MKPRPPHSPSGQRGRGESCVRSLCWKRSLSTSAPGAPSSCPLSWRRPPTNPREESTPIITENGPSPCWHVKSDSGGPLNCQAGDGRWDIYGVARCGTLKKPTVFTARRVSLFTTWIDELGQPDVSYFSKDCFHFHERGHAEMAKALWNNMLEPVGQKTDYNNYAYDRSQLKCPTNDHPYLFTLKNSGLPQDVVVEPEKVEDKGDQVPMWSVIVASIGGVALGCLVVGVAMHVSFKKKLSKQKGRAF